MNPFKQHTLKDLSYWDGFFEELSISDQPSVQVTNKEIGSISDQQKKQLQVDGYTRSSIRVDEKIRNRLVNGINQLQGGGYWPVFILLVDEVWSFLLKMDPYIQEILGGDYYVLPDFWAWNLIPEMGAKGWAPHRDRLVPVVRSDGMPNSITIWVSLTDSTPDSGCMYFLPASKDRNYPHNPHFVIEDWQNIRAVPAKKGDVLMWNQSVLHWGGECSEWAEVPRMSMAFEMQRADIDPLSTPLIDRKTIPSFKARLGILGKQLLQYQHMVSLSDDMKMWAEEVSGYLIKKVI